MPFSNKNVQEEMFGCVEGVLIEIDEEGVSEEDVRSMSGGRQGGG